MPGVLLLSLKRLSERLSERLSVIRKLSMLRCGMEAP